MKSLNSYTAKGLNCKSIFPEPHYQAMPIHLIADLEDAMTCVENELWTPLMLMNARILESELKGYIHEVLGIDLELNGLMDCYILFREKNYPDVFLNFILKLTMPNKQRRFEAEETLDAFQKMLNIVTRKYNCHKE